MHALCQEHVSFSTVVFFIILYGLEKETGRGVLIGKRGWQRGFLVLLSLTLLEDQKVSQCSRDSVAQFVASEPVVVHDTSKGGLQNSSNSEKTKQNTP